MYMFLLDRIKFSSLRDKEPTLSSPLSNYYTSLAPSHLPPTPCTDKPLFINIDFKVRMCVRHILFHFYQLKPFFNLLFQYFLEDSFIRFFVQ